MTTIDRSVQLARVVGLLGGAATASEVANVVVQSGLAALGASAGIVAVQSGDGRRLTIAGSQGFEGSSLAELTDCSIEDHNLLTEAIRGGRSITLEGPAERAAADRALRGWSPPGGEGTLLALPLTSAGRPLGALALMLPDGAAHGERLDYLAAIAVGAGQALDRIRFQEIEHSARRLSEALARMSAAAAAAATPSEVASAFVEQALPATGADRGTMYVLAGAKLELIATIGYPDETAAPRAEIPIDAAMPSAAAVRRRSAVVLRSPVEMLAEFPGMTEHTTVLGHRAFISLPMLVRGEILGAISIGFTNEHALSDEVISFLRSVADVAAQALARARLYDEATSSLSTLQAVIAQMPIGVQVASATDRRILIENTRAETLLGQRRAGQIAGYLEAFHPDGRPMVPSDWPLNRSIDSGEPVTGERYVIRRPDGSNVEVSTSAAPVVSNDIVVAAVMAMTDITAAREAEELREAFLGVLAHELRTPVTTIYGGAATLLRSRRRADSTSRAILADVAAESERLFRLVENLLVLARAERGAVVAERDPLSLVRVLPRVVDEERGRWPVAHFEIDMPTDLPIVSGDEAHVRLVLSNLLSNAAKYGPANGLVRVVAQRSEAGSEIEVRVLDEGPGVVESEADSMFRAFYRSASTASKAPGSGIGLFIVRALVDAMGGRVWTKAREGGGAEFGFALPVFEDIDPEL
ncbi:MAG TPA: ATP-binding protein [Candidatus Polarisedimenticolia bacterium]|nr:ATP-binding protein [Candidatus Polarisedimenticolia bacterium]